MNYVEAFKKHAKKVLPDWQYKKLHTKARSAAGGAAPRKKKRPRERKPSEAAAPAATDSPAEAIAKSALGLDTEAVELDVDAIVRAALGLQGSFHVADAVAKRKLRQPRAKVAKGRVKKSMAPCARPIIDAARQKQTVYCVGLEPDTFDDQNDRMTADEIEATAHHYMQNSRVIGSMHERPVFGATPVESYIAPQDLNFQSGMYGDQVVKKGSWVLGIKVTDPAEWAKVMSGEYSGISIGGEGKRSRVRE